MAGCKKSRGLNKPKMKTKRNVAKRFSKTASGLIKHRSKNRGHNLSNKTRKHNRQLRKAGYLTLGSAGLVARAIPYL
jgi:ribosomal protein L35